MKLAPLTSGLLVSAALLLFYLSAFQSMATIWWTSDTFAHGMLVFPISVWLAWSQRDRLRGVEIAGSGAGLVLVLVLGAAWLVARLAAIQVMQQGAVVMLVPALVWALFGSGVASAMLFPLLFLLFAVPFGEALIPHLMEFTADFTIAALQLIGLPVYRDGLYFSVPSGDFEVAKACSGIRYLIASIALGVLFAYMTYRSNVRRSLFVAAAIVVPIIANGLRAFGIVLLAHYSNRKLAVGVDHLVYGWLFFGIVMFALFWVGSWFREDDQADDHVGPGAADGAVASRPASVPVTRVVMVVAALLIAPAIFVGLEAADARTASAGSVALAAAQGEWRGPVAAANDPWETHFVGASRSFSGDYAYGEYTVKARIEYYDRQSQGAELINDLNRVYNTRYWARLTQAFTDVELNDGQTLRVRSERVRHDDDTLLIWYWYRVGDANENRAGMVKARELWRRLTLRGSSASMLAVGIEEHGDSHAAQRLLGDFLKRHIDALNACLTGKAPASGCAP